MSYQNQIHGVLLMVYIDFHTLIFHWSSVGVRITGDTSGSKKSTHSLLSNKFCETTIQK